MGSFLASETDMIFGDGVGASLVSTAFNSDGSGPMLIAKIQTVSDLQSHSNIPLLVMVYFVQRVVTGVLLKKVRFGFEDSLIDITESQSFSDSADRYEEIRVLQEERATLKSALQQAARLSSWQRRKKLKKAGLQFGSVQVLSHASTATRGVLVAQLISRHSCRPKKK